VACNVVVQSPRAWRRPDPERDRQFEQPTGPDYASSFELGNLVAPYTCCARVNDDPGSDLGETVQTSLTVSGYEW